METGAGAVTPPSEQCPLCPNPIVLSASDYNELKYAKGIKNCNKWTRKRKLSIKFKVSSILQQIYFSQWLGIQIFINWGIIKIETWCNTLTNNIFTPQKGTKVHKKCRRDHVNETMPTVATPSSTSSHADTARTRQRTKSSDSGSGFDYYTHCLFCGLMLFEKYENEVRSKIIQKTTLSFHYI